MVGALTSAGISETEAKVLAQKVEGGGAIVSARVDEAHAGPATAILRHAEGVDPAIDRQTLEAEGWTGFDEEGPREPKRIDEYPFVPPVV